MNSQADQAWDAYWRDGRIAACQADARGDYHGVVAEHWQAFFRALPERQRVLDLACGNGALARLALRARSGAGGLLEMHGVDQAAIQPPDDPDQLDDQLDDQSGAQLSEQSGVRLRWYPRTRLEVLPFATRMFDGCVSQYGLEYCDLDESVAEMRRVLRPDGWLRAVCHWRDGELARDAADEAGRAGQLLDLELPNRIVRLVELQHRNGSYLPDSHRRTWQTPEALSVKRGLAEGFQVARATPQHARGNLGLFLHNLAHLYQQREQYPVAEMLARMEECDMELRRHRQRLQALVNSALTEQRLQRLRELLDAHGLPLVRETLLPDPATGRTVGMVLHAGPDRVDSRTTS